MKYPSLSRASNVSANAARLLIQRRTLSILESATDEARTAKEIADIVGVRVGRIWHHLRNMVDAGLLIEVGARKRAGRPQTLYRCASLGFFVAAEDRRGTVGRRLAMVLEETLEIEDRTLGELFYHDGRRWRVEKHYDEDAPNEERQQDFWAILRLDARQREELAREMEALFTKYNKKEREDAPRALVRFASVSMPSELA